MTTGYTAWMIELYEDPTTMPTGRGFCGWWRGLARGGEDEPARAWTKDPNIAIKFLTREDAVHAAEAWGLTMKIHRVTEHVWMGDKMVSLPEPKLRRVIATFCELCLVGAGTSCNVPGCALCRSVAPDIDWSDMVEDVPATPETCPDCGGGIHARGCGAATYSPERGWTD